MIGTTEPVEVIQMPVLATTWITITLIKGEEWCEATHRESKLSACSRNADLAIALLLDKVADSFRRAAKPHWYK